LVALFKTVSDTIIVEKANSALKDLQGAEGHKFHSATRMRNGGLLLEMNDASTIIWLLTTDTKDPFLKAFEPTAMIMLEYLVYSIHIDLLELISQ
jgi:hypothetical protein